MHNCHSLDKRDSTKKGFVLVGFLFDCCSVLVNYWFFFSSNVLAFSLFDFSIGFSLFDFSIGFIGNIYIYIYIFSLINL